MSYRRRRFTRADYKNEPVPSRLFCHVMLSLGQFPLALIRILSIQDISAVRDPDRPQLDLSSRCVQYCLTAVS